MAETVIPRIGLTASQWNTYKTELFKKESSSRWDVIGGDANAYIGGYQAGAQALETAGYLKKGASVKNAFAWKNDQNWRKPNGDPITPGIRNYQDFLNSPQAQDDALLKYTQTNASTLSNFGIINNNIPASQRAGELAAAHLIGATGRNDRGIDGVDARGTKARTYYNDIGKAVGGGQTEPPPPINAAGTNATSRKTASGQGGSSASAGSTARTGSLLSNSSNSIQGAVTPRIARGGSSGDSEVTPILLPNPLEPFQSFNYLFTFSSLTSDAVNFPTTSYLQGDPGRVIFSSAGRYSENRVATAYQNPDNPSGKYDFFIDNVVMNHLVQPALDIGSTNLLTIDFEVIEPYSVGQFLQSCQIAAFANGHYSYVDAPFLLTLEFRGYVDDASVTIENTTRHMPVKFRSVTVAMSESGTKYQVSVIAWSDLAFDDDFNRLKQDTVISGKSVVEILQTGESSLQQVVNVSLKEIATRNKEKSYVPDEIAVVFPKLSEPPPAEPASNSGATTSSTSTGDLTSKIKLNRDEKTRLLTQAASDVNEIGNAIFNFDATTGGDVPKQPDTPIVIKGIPNGKFTRNSFNNKYDQREFTFRKGTTIVNAVTEILLMSEYCAGIVDAKPDQSGKYKWFRIESQVYVLTPNENNKAVGKFPKLLIYRLVPYLVHMSKFQSPDVTSKGYEEIAKEAVKEYNYIYTGKNVDVLDFKLNLNVNYGTNILADGLGAFSGSPLLTQLGKSGAAFDEKSTAFIADPQKAASGEGGGDKGLGITKQRSLESRWKTSDGAGLADNYRALVARVFQDRMLNGDAEFVSANMTILGDPYYISSSGIGNYSNSNTESRNNVTSLGSFDYQKGEVDILFNFLTPVDLSSAGSLLFESTNDTILKVPFSGLYFIRVVTSTFSKGKFTQVLDIVRRVNQNTKNTLNEQLSNTGGTGVKKDAGAVTAQQMIDEQNAIFEAGFENDNKSYTDFDPYNE
jgi:hypothetical protein